MTSENLNRLSPFTPMVRKVFTEEEEVALATAVKDREGILFGQFNSASVSRKAKTKAWLEVTSAVNAVGGQNRTVEQIKTKHKNLKAETKRRAAKINRTVHKTGGGNSDIEELSEPQTILLQTIPKECVNGIEGGIDLHLKSPSLTAASTNRGTSTTQPEVITKTPVLSLVGALNPNETPPNSPGKSQQIQKSPTRITEPSGAIPNQPSNSTGTQIEEQARTPHSGKRTIKKGETSRAEKLMQEQVSNGKELVSVTERLVDAVKEQNEIQKRKVDLLERLVIAKEEELSLKRQKLHHLTSNM